MQLPVVGLLSPKPLSMTSLLKCLFQSFGVFRRKKYSQLLTANHSSPQRFTETRTYLQILTTQTHHCTTSPMCKSEHRCTRMIEHDGDQSSYHVRLSLERCTGLSSLYCSARSRPRFKFTCRVVVQLLYTACS